ncbi:MAG: hypothetical protein ACM3YF_06310 [Candidatus Zixiibacteriota bacterium]
MNCDASVTPTDVVLLLNRVYFGTGTFCDNPAIKGDLNCDGFRDGTDAVLLFQVGFTSICHPCPPSRPTIPDPRDSVILESKTVAPGTGSPVTTVRVWITNHDSIANLTLPLEIRTVSGDAFLIVSWPRTFSGTVTRLTSTLGSFLTFGPRLNSVGPDSAQWAAFYDPTDPATIEPPNTSRKALWDIKFDTISGGCGQVVLDSIQILDNTVHFAGADAGRIPVHFVAGTVTVNAAPVGQDLRVSINHFGAATRGSWRCVRIQCRNIGTCASTGTATLQLPPQAEAVFGYDRGYPAAGGASRSVPVAIDTGARKITWNVPSLAVGEGLYLWARYKVPCNIANGTPLVSSVRLGPFLSDIDSSNNTAVITKPAAAGASPCNMFGKTAVALAYGEVFGLGAIDTLTMLILFQNVGDAITTDVLVRDSLDFNLNEATFDSAGASHPFSFGISGNELSWTLDNINLPDSGSSPSGSVGFVAFRIRADGGLPEGTVIEHKALLNFDGGPTFVTASAPVRVCVQPPGDINGDTALSPSDVVLMLNCVFLSSGGCTMCADHNCDGNLSPADVVKELNAVFLLEPISCL